MSERDYLISKAIRDLDVEKAFLPKTVKTIATNTGHWGAPTQQVHVAHVPGAIGRRRGLKTSFGLSSTLDPGEGISRRGVRAARSSAKASRNTAPAVARSPYEGW